MAFTYLGDLSTNLDKVRFYLQDTVSGSGPKPNDGNFTDGELEALVTTEGSWQRAVAAGFETLASAWRKFINFSADGSSYSLSNVADGYAAQAKDWRLKFGTGGAKAGSRAITRVDGYSSDVDSEET